MEIINRIASESEIPELKKEILVMIYSQFIERTREKVTAGEKLNGLYLKFERHFLIASLCLNSYIILLRHIQFYNFLNNEAYPPK